MGKLMGLPNEILEKILICAIDSDPEFNVNGDSRWDIASDRFCHTRTTRKFILNVELVNRRLKEIAEPLRLRQWSDDIEGEGAPPDYFALAVELLRNPGLCSRLRRLEFHTSITATEQEDRDLNDSVPPETDLSDLAAEVRSLSLPGADKNLHQDWANTIDDGKVDGIPPLLLAWATNLTSLAVTFPYFDPKHHENFMLLRWLTARVRSPRPANPSAKLPLDNLQDVYLRWWDTEGSLEHKYAAPFYHLESVKRLWASRLGHCSSHEVLMDGMSDTETDDEDSDDASVDDPQDVASGHIVPKDVVQERYHTAFGMSNIEELHLVEADLDSHALNELISNCRRLKSLKVSWSTGIENDTQNEYAWGYVLKLHAKSLEVLELDFSESDHEWIWRPYKNNRTVDLGGSLAHLSCLRELRIEIYYLCGDEDPPGSIHVERLPAMLELLTIADTQKVDNWNFYKKGMEDYVRRGPAKVLAECRPDGRLPQVRALDFTQMLIDDVQVECIVALKTAAVDQGIELKLLTEYASSGVVLGVVLGLTA